MDKKVTIHDIAREAGVSAATVSYIINNRPDKTISEETKKKVLQIVNLYNYKPGAFAKNLRAAPDSKLISVYMGKSGNLLYTAEFGYFVENLHKVFPNDKYGLVLSGLPYRHLDNVDAIIAFNIDRDSFIEIGNLNYVPLISVDCIVKDTLFFQITTDYKKLKSEADKYFNGDYEFITLLPADVSIKEEILSTFKSVRFAEKMYDLHLINNGKNVLTDSKVIFDYLSGTDTKLLFPNKLAADKCARILSCLDEAMKRIPFAVHNYEV
ncbi:MAG: LacI family DNA-binding transcriptional regulator [Clostridia bacterium]|nr:LacI family DNA-binding transcriptional regulator [Clostridia bacterium]